MGKDFDIAVRSARSILENFSADINLIVASDGEDMTINMPEDAYVTAALIMETLSEATELTRTIVKHYLEGDDDEK